MITRNPRAAIASAWPNLIQFIWASENSPWSRITARPSPISRQASSTPSEAVQWWVVGSVIRVRKFTKFTPQRARTRIRSDLQRFASSHMTAQVSQNSVAASAAHSGFDAIFRQCSSVMRSTRDVTETALCTYASGCKRSFVERAHSPTVTRRRSAQVVAMCRPGLDLGTASSMRLCRACAQPHASPTSSLRCLEGAKRGLDPSTVGTMLAVASTSCLRHVDTLRRFSSRSLRSLFTLASRSQARSRASTRSLSRSAAGHPYRLEDYMYLARYLTTSASAFSSIALPPLSTPIFLLF